MHDRCSVHIDSHAGRQYKACNLLAASKLVDTCPRVQRETCRGGVGGEPEDADFRNLLDKLYRILLCGDPDSQRIEGCHQEEQGEHRRYHVRCNRSQILYAVDCKRPGNQAEDCNRTDFIDQKCKPHIDNFA